MRRAVKPRPLSRHAGDTTAAIYDSVNDALDTVEDDPSTLAGPGTFADASEKAINYGLGVCGG